MNNQNYQCPLCLSILTKEKWIRITGQWEERQKLINSTKEELEKYKKEKLQLEKQFKADKQKAIKAAEEAGVIKGIKKEKGERERMRKMLQNQTKTIITGQKKIEELQKQLKEGKTPQIAGFEYEKEAQRMLSDLFPDDRVQSTGKMGDIIQFVVFGKEDIGSILYECKKTEKYDNGFIKEIKTHQDVARADFAVIVTHAQRDNKSKFFIEDGIIVIDPLGFLDIAYLLRNTLIDMHRLKLTKEQTNQKGQEIILYMQKGEFKKYMVDNLDKSRDAYNLLIKEVKSHKRDWEERIKIYATIHQNTQNVRRAIGKIITGREVLEDVEALPNTIEPLQLNGNIPGKL